MGVSGMNPEHEYVRLAQTLPCGSQAFSIQFVAMQCSPRQKTVPGFIGMSILTVRLLKLYRCRYPVWTQEMSAQEPAVKAPLIHCYKYPLNALSIELSFRSDIHLTCHIYAYKPKKLRVAHFTFYFVCSTSSLNILLFFGSVITEVIASTFTIVVGMTAGHAPTSGMFGVLSGISGLIDNGDSSHGPNRDETLANLDDIVKKQFDKSRKHVEHIRDALFGKPGTKQSSIAEEMKKQTYDNDIIRVFGDGQWLLHHQLLVWRSNSLMHIG